VGAAFDSFANRVALLRDTWSDRRQTAHLSGHHDYESQFQLLRLLYEWSAESCQVATDLYGDGLPLTLSEPPVATDGGDRFKVALGSRLALTFAMRERTLARRESWTVAACLEVSGRDGRRSRTPPDRRNAAWTRVAVENLILELLAFWERLTPRPQAP
jgi:hypothetical protein